MDAEETADEADEVNGVAGTVPDSGGARSVTDEAFSLFSIRTVSEKSAEAGRNARETVALTGQADKDATIREGHDTRSNPIGGTENPKWALLQTEIPDAETTIRIRTESRKEKRRRRSVFRRDLISIP